MLHEARMNFQRTIVNRAPRFPCRGAAQFNFAAAVDAPMAPLIHIVGHRRRAPEQRCWLTLRSVTIRRGNGQM